MTYLLKISRTFYCRVVVPTDLKDHFPTRELKRSLRTRSLSEARKVLPSMLASIQDHFYLLRSNRMPKEPTITAEAVTTFRKMYPSEETHHAYKGGCFLPEGEHTRLHPDLIKVQEKLDEGWQLNENGQWRFVGVQQQPTIQAPLYPALTAVALPVVIPAPVPQKSMLMLSEAKERWIKHLTAPADTVHYTAKAPSTIRSSEYALEALSKWLGNKDVPVNSLLDRDFRQLTVFMTDGTLSKNSAKTRLLRTLAFFKYLHDDLSATEKIDRIPTIIFPKLNAEEQGNLAKANSPYTYDELNRFFSFIIDSKLTRISDRKTALSLAYLILAFIYTGFRISEQLYFSRDKIKKINGIDYFDFTFMTKNTLSAIRMIPVHSKLEELGFLKFTKKQPELIFSLDQSTYSRNFTLILKTLKIKGKRGEKTFHSCRKTFDCFIQGLIEDSSRKVFMGHTKSGMDSVYLRQLLDKMPMYKDDIEKLTYDLDFPRLKAHLLNEIEELYP